MAMKVREAWLDDAEDITAIYRTNPDRPYERPIEGLTIAERIGYGGDWMSVESCAIHLNNLLAWGCAPLVVEDEGKVIAETEYYMGPDVPPLDTTLDISVIFVHSDFQRRGAGTMLMEELIARAKRGHCQYVTVSGGLGAPGFYAHFGFEHLFDLQGVDCGILPGAATCNCRPFVPADFEKPPECPLWIGRFHNPFQEWQNVVNEMKKRDTILREHAGRPRSIGRISEKPRFLGLLSPTWPDPLRADVSCWAEALTGEVISEMLTHARTAGYVRAFLLCHPDVVPLVSGICGSASSDKWEIWGKKVG
jgi:GNAT superfamily N-acetyltransferase